MAPLHRAAARGHTAVIERLLAAGADPRQRSAAGQTAPMYAAQFGHRGALAALLDPRWHVQQGAADGGRAALRAYVALCDSAGMSALHLAAQWGMADAAADLVLGPGWQLPPGQAAQQGGCPAGMAEAPAAAAAAGAQAAPDRQPQEEQQLAAPPRLLPGSARRLADPDCRTANEEGLTPAHLAARWGHAGTLRMLGALGADLRLRARGSGRSPLEEAREWSRPACVELLEGLRE